jgi:hypothetical protein
MGAGDLGPPKLNHQPYLFAMPMLSEEAPFGAALYRSDNKTKV